MAEKIFCCTKYSLMACNAFGIMLGIYVVLFGMSYPHESFPGGYTGQNTALASVVMIFFALVGYCGAHHHKALFLIAYSIIILILTAANVVFFFALPKYSIFNQGESTFFVVTAVLVFILAFACAFAYQVRRRTEGTFGRQFNSYHNSGGGIKNADSEGYMTPQPSISYGPPPRFTAIQSTSNF